MSWSAFSSDGLAEVDHEEEEGDEEDEEVSGGYREEEEEEEEEDDDDDVLCIVVCLVCFLLSWRRFEYRDWFFDTIKFVYVDEKPKKRECYEER